MKKRHDVTADILRWRVADVHARLKGAMNQVNKHEGCTAKGDWKFLVCPFLQVCGHVYLEQSKLRMQLPDTNIILLSSSQHFWDTISQIVSVRNSTASINNLTIALSIGFFRQPAPENDFNTIGHALAC